MRWVSAGFVLFVAACSLAERAGAAPQFADTICPQAAQYVTALGTLRQQDPPQRIYDAAQAATDAYERCSREKLSYGYREAQHYADVRAAGFAVVASRALIALGRLNDAKSELQHWRALAQQVVDWRPETEAYASADANGSSTTQSYGNNLHSRYSSSASEIVAAIDVELTTIAQRSGDVSRPQAVAPQPSPSSSH